MENLTVKSSGVLITEYVLDDGEKPMVNWLADDGELNAVATSIVYSLDKEIKAYADKLKAIKAEMLQAMIDGDVKKFENDEFSVSRIDESMKEKFDTKQFRYEHPDVYDRYISFTKTAPSIRFTAKKK